jgi:uncharacterized phage-associated protein
MEYNEKIAAQVAAYFIHCEGGAIKILKLMKLMYLTERESLHRYGVPMMGDTLVSMQHGPVMSITLDHMNDCIDSKEGGWNDWISDRANHCVSLKTEEDPTDNLLELSDADIEVMESIYGEFGSMTAFQIRDYTHSHCGEWEDPNYSSSPIPYDRLLKNVGYSPEVAEEIKQKINDQSRLDNLLSFAG